MILRRFAGEIHGSAQASPAAAGPRPRRAAQQRAEQRRKQGAQRKRLEEDLWLAGF